MYTRGKMIVIMLSGWAGSGKDAAAALLLDEMDFRRFAFADSLKDDIAELTNLPTYMFTESCFKDRYLSEKSPLYPTAMTPRELLLQHAARMKHDDPDIYARVVSNKIRDTTVRRVVISDWRHVAEHDFIRASLPDASIIRCRIVRRGVIPSDHPTEHELDDEPMDFVIRNDGSISDLRTNLHHLIDRARHWSPKILSQVTSDLLPEVSISEHLLGYPCDDTETTNQTTAE